MSWNFLAQLDRIEQNQALIIGKLNLILRKEQTIMAELSDFNAELDKIEAAEQGIDARIAALQAQIDGGNLTAEQEQAVLDRITALRGELEADANPPA